MSWFRKKGKYWYFVTRIEGKEKQYYIGSDKVILDKLLPNQKINDHKKVDQQKKGVVGRNLSRKQLESRSGSTCTA